MLKVETATSLVNDWNAALEEMTEETKAHNAKLEQDYKEEKILAETLIEGIQPLPVLLKHPTEQWARWWKASWGWSVLSRSGDEQAGWLEFSHPDMVQARDEFGKLLTEHGVCLNYDQVWRNAFSIGRVPLMYKPREYAGERRHKSKLDSRLDKKLHSIRGARRSITVLWYEYSAFSLRLRNYS